MRDFFSNRYVRMLGAYVGIGVAAVIAYSPGLMALSPMDPSILRAGASLIAGVLMCVGLGVSTHMAMRDERRYVPLGTGAQGVDPQVVTRALEANEADEVLGALARRGVGALRDGAKKVETLRTLVFARFSQGSMTSERFMSAVQLSADTVARNCAVLANLMTGFDSRDYLQLRALMQGGAYRHDDIPDDIQLKKFDLYQEQLSTMGGIATANERLLLEMDRFSTTLATLDVAGEGKKEQALLDEMRQLTEQTKYYQ
jgi:hypothetical protein